MHVLCDSQDARQARHQADRRSDSPRPSELAADGVRELVDRRPGHDLLRHGPVRRAAAGRVAAASWSKSTGIDWIRLMYLYPMYVDDELIDTIAASTQDRARTSTCRCSTSTTRMLRRMQRRVTRDADREPAGQAPRAHPGSRAADHVHHRLSRRDRRAVRRAGRSSSAQRFERLGVFTYSFEPDTPAAAARPFAGRGQDRSAASG